MPTKNLKFTVLIGALIVSGLFFYLNKKSDTPTTPIQDLKPSQLNFSESNKIAQPAEVELAEPKPEVKIEPKLNEVNLQKWTALEEILKSKNDNDPRINTDLKHNDAEFHKALYAKYQSLSDKNRNARGLMVFLITRDFKSAEDAEFLKKVYQEEPCFSLEDCKTIQSSDPHFSGMNQTTLNYPQLTGLYQLEQQLKFRPELLKDAQMRAAILEILKNAENFNVPVIQERAQALRRKFGL